MYEKAYYYTPPAGHGQHVEKQRTAVPTNTQCASHQVGPNCRSYVTPPVQPTYHVRPEQLHRMEHPPVRSFSDTYASPSQSAYNQSAVSWPQYSQPQRFPLQQPQRQQFQPHNVPLQRLPSQHFQQPNYPSQYTQSQSVQSQYFPAQRNQLQSVPSQRFPMQHTPQNFPPNYSQPQHCQTQYCQPQQNFQFPPFYSQQQHSHPQQFQPPCFPLQNFPLQHPMPQNSQPQHIPQQNVPPRHYHTQQFQPKCVPSQHVPLQQFPPPQHSQQYNTQPPHLPPTRLSSQHIQQQNIPCQNIPHLNIPQQNIPWQQSQPLNVPSQHIPPQSFPPPQSFNKVQQCPIFKNPCPYNSQTPRMTMIRDPASKISNNTEVSDEPKANEKQIPPLNIQDWMNLGKCANGIPALNQASNDGCVYTEGLNKALDDSNLKEFITRNAKGQPTLEKPILSSNIRNFKNGNNGIENEKAALNQTLTDSWADIKVPIKAWEILENIKEFVPNNVEIDVEPAAIEMQNLYSNCQYWTKDNIRTTDWIPENDCGYITEAGRWWQANECADIEEDGECGQMNDIPTVNRAFKKGDIDLKAANEGCDAYDINQVTREIFRPVSERHKNATMSSRNVKSEIKNKGKPKMESMRLARDGNALISEIFSTVFQRFERDSSARGRELRATQTVLKREITGRSIVLSIIRSKLEINLDVQNENSKCDSNISKNAVLDRDEFVSEIFEKYEKVVDEDIEKNSPEINWDEFMATEFRVPSSD